MLEKTMTSTYDARAVRDQRLSTWGNRLVIAAIIANTFTVAWLFFDHNELVEHLDIAILWFFVAEILVRIKTAVHRGTLRDRWLWFDTTIIVLSLLPLGANLIALRIMRASRLIHFSRHMPHLRHLRIFRWIPVLTKGGVQ